MNGFLEVNRLRMVSFNDLMAAIATIRPKAPSQLPLFARLRIGCLLHIHVKNAKRQSWLEAVAFSDSPFTKEERS
jgi:hypothetical protein